ncbi:Ig-like domain-containing protein [Diaphorobacter caeni]|uniref:Ig-like domain-containing protein n=1 Tax=Diaphorobacter caeni TaxID=2784387 RepID=UPI00188DF98D|nr:Ig-like domain-containing protein [Diaphorobacter caeni]MBF5007673.1 IPTL-CTERM sorting domain-containing protein [Diaphorobacter caeni]
MAGWKKPLAGLCGWGLGLGLVLSMPAHAADVFVLKTDSGGIKSNLHVIPLSNASPPALRSGSQVSINTITFRKNLADVTPMAAVYVDGLALTGKGVNKGKLFAFVHPNMTGTGNGSSTGGNASKVGAILVTLTPSEAASGKLEAKRVGEGVMRADALMTGAGFDMSGNLWALNHFKGTLEQIALEDSGAVKAGTALKSLPVVIDPASTTPVYPNTSYPEGSSLGDIAFDLDGKAYLSGYTGATGADRVRELEIGSDRAVLKASTSALTNQQYGGLGFYRDNEGLIVNASGGDKLVHFSNYKPGWVGADLHTVIANLTTSVSPNSGATDLASLPNRALAVNDGPFTVIPGSSPLPIDVLVNDSNVQEEDMLVKAIPTAPTKGTASIATDGKSITYVAHVNATGTDSFTYQMCSVVTEVCATATVSIVFPPPPDVSLLCSPLTLTDSTGQFATCTVTSSAPAPAAGLPLDLTLPAALTTSRYDASGCTALQLIPAGERSASCQVNATPNTDPWDGNVSMAAITLNAPAATAFQYVVAGPASSGPIEVNNDDAPPALTLACLPTVLFDRSAQQAICTVTSPIAAPASGLSVNVAASSDPRYATTCNGTLLIAPGAFTQTCELTAAANNDPWDGSVNAQVSVLPPSAGAPAYAVGSGPASVAIQNDDSANVSVACTPATINDSTDQQSICTITSSSPAPAGDLKVSLAIADLLIPAKTAAVKSQSSGKVTVSKAGAADRYDASACAQPQVIAEGATSTSCVLMAVANDVAGDGSVEITLTVQAPAAGDAAFTADATPAKVTVLDDDKAAPPVGDAQPVPTLGEFALGALALLMLACGMRSARRVRTQESRVDR